MMGKRDHQSEQNEMCQDQSQRRLVLVRLIDGRRDAAEFSTEHHGGSTRINHYCQNCFPTERSKHERDVPLPGTGNHQHGRRSERGESSSDGHIHEEDSESPVLDRKSVV